MRNRIAVLVSGTGSLLDAIIADELPIALVLADRMCEAYERYAPKEGEEKPLINTALVDRSWYMDGSVLRREQFTRVINSVLKRFEVDFIVMAGFMTMLSPEFFTEENFGGRVLNIHSSLLPLFPGAHVERVLYPYVIRQFIASL